MGKRKVTALLHREGFTCSVSAVGRIVAHLIKRGAVVPVPILRRMPANRRIRLTAKERYARRLSKGRRANSSGELVQTDTLFVNVSPNGSIKHFTAYDPVVKWTLDKVATEPRRSPQRVSSISLSQRRHSSSAAFKPTAEASSNSFFEQEREKRGLELFVLPPKRPDLNSCVERAQSTWRYEFYATYDLPARIDKLQTFVYAFAHSSITIGPTTPLADKLRPNILALGSGVSAASASVSYLMSPDSVLTASASESIIQPMTINVVHSCEDWLPQTQTWVYNQFRYLPIERVQAYVVCRRTQNLNQFDVPNLHVLGGRRSWRFWWDRLPRKLRLWNHSTFLVGIGRRARAHLVHSHFGPVGWSDAASARRIPARHIVSFYGYDMSWLPVRQPIWKERYKELFATVERVLCEGPFMGDALVRLGCPREKIRIHHLGIETEKIVFVPRRWNSGTPLRVLIAATFTEKKGIPDALEALGRIAGGTKIEITVIGDARPGHPRDQRELARIRRTIDTYGLSSIVQFLGYQTHARLFEEAYKHHIYLSPSVAAADGDTEGGAPVTLIELAATGMPVVSTYHCDIPHVIEPRCAGLLAKEHDVEELVEHITWLIQNPAAWRDMVTTARERIDSEFNAKMQGSRLASIYEEIAQ